MEQTAAMTARITDARIAQRQGLSEVAKFLRAKLKFLGLAVACPGLGMCNLLFGGSHGGSEFLLW